MSGKAEDDEQAFCRNLPKMLWKWVVLELMEDRFCSRELHLSWVLLSGFLLGESHLEGGCQLRVSSVHQILCEHDASDKMWSFVVGLRHTLTPAQGNFYEKLRIFVKCRTGQIRAITLCSWYPKGYLS